MTLAKAVDLSKKVSTPYGEITIGGYRLFTASYAWLMIGPGGILSTGYIFLAILFALASTWLFLRHPVSRWLREQTSWFSYYYLGWSLTWIFLAYFFYPSTENMGKVSLVLFLNFIHGMALIPSWRELEAKLFK